MMIDSLEVVDPTAFDAFFKWVFVGKSVIKRETYLKFEPSLLCFHAIIITIMFLLQHTKNSIIFLVLMFLCVVSLLSLSTPSPYGLVHSCTVQRIFAHLEMQFLFVKFIRCDSFTSLSYNDGQWKNNGQWRTCFSS